MGNDLAGCLSSKRQHNPNQNQLAAQSPLKAQHPTQKFMNPIISKHINSRPNLYEGIVATFHGVPRKQWVPISQNYVYKGEWDAEKRHGQGFLYDLREHSLLVGCFYQNNPITLKCRKIYSDQSEYVGQLNETFQKHGNGVLKGKNFKYEGRFKNNMFDGEGHYQSKDQIFDGIFEKGLKKNGVEKNRVGVYEGPFDKGLKQGMGKFKWIDGGKFEGPFHLDKPHGIGKLYDKDNNYCGKRTFEEGKLAF